MKRILIADDNEHVVRILYEGIRRVLGDRDLDIETAAEGKGALTRLDAGGVDLAILDLFMPNLDGVKLIARLRDDPAHAALRILVVTAGGPDMLRQALDAGADQVLLKPLRLHDVADAVSALLRL